MTNYKSYRFVDGKARWIIVDDNGKIINKIPSKEELKGIQDVPWHMLSDGRSKPRLRYKVGDLCKRCIEDKNITKNSILCPGNSNKEKNKEGIETGRIICSKHSRKDYSRYNSNSNANIIKKMRPCRVCNQYPNSSHAKGDQDLEIICELYGYQNLNKENDNYSTGTPIDCYDPKTGFYHQVRGMCYNSLYKCWNTSHLDREWYKEYKDMIFICKNNNGKIIERIYRFPFTYIKERIGIYITKYDSMGRPYNGLHEKYRIIDDIDLKRANEIFDKITVKQ